MRATFNHVQNLASASILEGMEAPVKLGLSGILGRFLGNSLICMGVFVLNSKKEHGRKVTDSRTYRPKLSAGGQGAVWVNSVRIDQYYHLPGASPPT